MKIGWIWHFPLWKWLFWVKILRRLHFLCRKYVEMLLIDDFFILYYLMGIKLFKKIKKNSKTFKNFFFGCCNTHPMWWGNKYLGNTVSNMLLNEYPQVRKYETNGIVQLISYGIFLFFIKMIVFKLNEIYSHIIIYIELVRMTMKES